MRLDPALAFWIDFVQAQGALVEADGDRAVALLPAALQEQLELGEEVILTSDPEIAREDEALLLMPGHPAMERAVGGAIDAGDVGHVLVGWPPNFKLPSGTALVDLARERIQVDHGRFDYEGEPLSVHLPVLRLGVLVTYMFQHPFQEAEEALVHADSGQPVSQRLHERLIHLEFEPDNNLAAPSVVPDLERALAGAHELVQARAEERGRALARQVRQALRDEHAAADAYYDAVLASIERRRTQAPAERQTMYDARAEATRNERARRRLEIEDKYRPRAELRPFRLQLILLPGLVLPIAVRRGSRRYGFHLRWNVLAGDFLSPECPACGTYAPLVAGRDGLGCETCLPRSAEPAPLRTVQPRRRIAPPPAQALRQTAQPPARATTISQPEVRPVPDAPPAPILRPEPAAAGAGDGEQLLLLPQAIPPPPEKPRPAEPVRPVDRNLEVETEQWQRLVRDINRIDAAGDELADAFWERVFEKRPWRRVASDSPLSVLYQLYGPTGPLHAIGMPVGVLPDSYTSWTSPHQPDSNQITAGELRVGRDTYSYRLHWRQVGGKAVVSEVEPGYQALTGDLEPDGGPMFRPPRPRGALGALESTLWETDLPLFGLPLVVRCFAFWWHIRDLSLLRRHAPAVLAAALMSVVGLESGRHLRHGDGHRRLRRAGLAEVHGAHQKALDRAARELNAVLRARPVRFG